MREPEQRRELVTLGDQPVEHRHVDRMGAVVELHVHAPAQRRTLRVEEDRQRVGGVDRQRHRAVGSDGVARHEVGRQPAQLVGARRHGAGVGADVAAEFLADGHELFVERAHARPRRRVAIDTGEPEFAQRLRDVVPRRRVGLREIDRRQGVVDAAMETEIGAERGGLLRRALGRLAQRAFGMDVLDQRRLRGDRLEAGEDVVVERERAIHGAREIRRHQPVDRGAQALQAALAQPCQLVAARRVRPQRTFVRRGRRRPGGRGHGFAGNASPPFSHARQASKPNGRPRNCSTIVAAGAEPPGASTRLR